MKNTLKARSLTAALFAFGSLVGGANAALTLTFTEVGDDVVMEASGSVNVSSATFVRTSTLSPAAFYARIRPQIVFARHHHAFVQEYEISEGIFLNDLTSSGQFDSATTFGINAQGSPGGNFQIVGNQFWSFAGTDPGVSDDGTESATITVSTHMAVFNNHTFESLNIDHHPKDVDIGLWKASENIGQEGFVNFRLSSVPEPSSMALLGLGFLGLTFKRSRHISIAR